MEVKILNLIIMSLSAWIIGLGLAIVGKIVIDGIEQIKRIHSKP